MYVGDSRVPAGPGFLPLQHHNYRGKGWSLDGRSAVLAMRIVDRRDSPGQLGRWVYKDESVGDLTGGFLWDKDTRPVSGWRFSWPAIVGSDSRSITPPPIISPPPTSTSPSTPPATGSSPGDTPATTSPQYSSAYTPKGSTINIGGQMVVLTSTIGPGLPAGNIIAVGAGGAGGAAKAAAAAGVARNAFKANAVNQNAAGGAGGVNAFGQKNLGLLFPNAGAVGGAPNVFGLNVQWLNPVYPWAPNPRAPFGLQVNPMGINIAGALGGDQGNFSMAGQFASAKSKEESDSKAWYSGDLDVGVTRPPDELFPVWRQWDPDRRFKGLVPSKPEYWPDIPRGFYGIVLDSTEEDNQNPLFMPTDPRLIAAHRNFPPMGSLVADIDANGSVDIHRTARLQTALRVARKPSGTVGILKRNTGERATNWLALVIGPTGGWDGAGGLVVDTPWGGAPDRAFRIFGALSQREGGPFDVGTRKDLHGIGKTADGEVINSLHISTGALFLRKGSVTEDGPLAFESVWQDGIDFDITTKVHCAFNQRAGSWGWWTTSPVTIVTTDTPDPGPPPVTPTPKPPTPVTPRPNGPVGGPPERGGVPDPGAGGVPGPDRGGNAVNPPTGGVGGTGSSINVSYREMGLASLSGRPTFMRKGETDLRFARYAPLADRVAIDDRTPLVGRLEPYGAQGGSPGGPHVTGGRESSGWAYTTKPGASRWPAGTSNGGWALLPPEVELSSIDKGLRPTGIPISESYLVATIGTHFAAGTPELATGRVKDGYSWTYDPAIDLLVFSDRDSVGDALPVFGIGPYGYNQKVKTTGVDYTVERGITVVIATAGLTVTLPAAADPGVLGTLIIVKSNTTGNLVITDPTSTIDGSATTTINQRYNSVQLFSDGAEWFIV